MLLAKVRNLSKVNLIRQTSRTFSSSNKNDETSSKPQDVHPARRLLRLFKNDMKTVKDFVVPSKTVKDPKKILNNEIESSNEEDIDEVLQKYESKDQFQTHCDVLVIGGGGVGSSIAYWLKKRALHGLNVVVLEKDPTYKKASTVLSVGGLRQQFSLEENIQMSLYGADFMRDAKELLHKDVELNFTPYGYLMLSTEEGADVLRANSTLQNHMGAKNEILTAKKLKQKFPWLNTQDIAVGCHGLEKEGWFDPWALLMGYKNSAKQLGAHFCQAELTGFEFRSQPDIFVEGTEPGSYEGLDKAIVKMPDGEVRSIKFAICVVAAGANSGNVAKMARIGTGPGMLSVPLPVEPRKRYVYVVQSQGENAPGINTPLVIDPSNAYFRRDGFGGNYLCGCSPDFTDEPSCENLDVDYEWFNTHVWPKLANRVPAFNSLKVSSAWAGFYEYNTFDENGIIGPHPYYTNLYIATGFSGHGIQQTPAVGRAISELIIDGQFRTIDLTRLGFDRIIVDQPMREVNIV